MTTKYGAGTDPLGLDTAKFEFIDQKSGETLDLKDIKKGDGTFKQGDARIKNEELTLQYYCETDDPKTDGPAIGSYASGFDIVGRDFGRNQEGHSTMTLKVRKHTAVTTTLTL